MSKFGAIIEKAKSEGIEEQENKQTIKKVSQNTGLPENQNTSFIKSSEPVEKGREVNLSIKVPEVLRRHWVSEAKKEGSTITAEITEALNRKYGKP